MYLFIIIILVFFSFQSYTHLYISELSIVQQPINSEKAVDGHNHIIIVEQWLQQWQQWSLFRLPAGEKETVK